MVTYFEPFHVIIEEPGLDQGLLVTYFCFLTPTFLLKNQVVWTKSYYYYDTKWFKICYQDYKLVVCCILDGFMLCKRHLTIRFCQNWKKLEKSNRFWKNLLRATWLCKSSIPHGDSIGWEDSKNAQLFWFTPDNTVTSFKNVKNTFVPKVFRKFSNSKNLTVPKFLTYID